MNGSASNPGTNSTTVLPADSLHPTIQVLTPREYEQGLELDSNLELVYYELFSASHCRVLRPENADWFFLPLATQSMYLLRQVCTERVCDEHRTAGCWEWSAFLIGGGFTP